MKTALDLLIDIGNSRSKWLTQKSSQRGNALQIIDQGTIENSQLKDQLPLTFHFLNSSDSQYWIENIFFTSVAQQTCTQEWVNYFSSANYFELKGNASFPGFTNLYQNPMGLGADRLAAMFGAMRLFPRQNCLIVSSGTATTIDVLTAEAVFQGGWIIPGFDLMFHSLGHFTAHLPTLNAKELSIRKDQKSLAIDPGRSTQLAIGKGVMLSQVGSIDKALEQTQGINVLILTGGNASVLFQYFETNLPATLKLEKVSDLILQGIDAWRCTH